MSNKDNRKQLKVDILVRHCLEHGELFPISEDNSKLLKSITKDDIRKYAENACVEYSYINANKDVMVRNVARRIKERDEARA